MTPDQTISVATLSAQLTAETLSHVTTPPAGTDVTAVYEAYLDKLTASYPATDLATQLGDALAAIQADGWTAETDETNVNFKDNGGTTRKTMPYTAGAPAPLTDRLVSVTTEARFAGYLAAVLTDSNEVAFYDTTGAEVTRWALSAVPMP